MIKFSNFCGIFATVFVTTTIILLASCSQDDDYYESDMYTLAEMETRGGGGDPGGGDDGNIPFQENECGIWCILYLKKEIYKYSSYSILVDSATSNTIGWDRDSGGALYGEQMQALGNMFGIGFDGWRSNEAKDGHRTNSANIKLRELLDDESRYDNKGNLMNVIISIEVLRQGEIRPHYVVVKGYDNKKKTKVAVYDVNESQNGYYSSVSFDKILGVIY